MTAFVDPRGDLSASATKPHARTTADPASLAELFRLCRDGRLYDVERWIQAGRPLQLAAGTTVERRRLTSALEIALETKNQALVLLLLCNGYDPNLESPSPLDIALRGRRFDLVDLLLEWGADPHRVSLCDLFSSYNSGLLERFRTFGVDLTAGHELAEALAYHTSNKPLLGFAKRLHAHDPAIQQELNIALVYHAVEGNEKGVQLCLWAGADPHAPALDLRYPGLVDEDGDEKDEDDRYLGSTAIEEACRQGDPQILARLGPDPLRDDFDNLFRAASNRAVVDLLAQSTLPKDVGDVIRWHALLLEISPFGHQRSVDTLRRVFEVGARWTTSSAEETASVRRSVLRMSDQIFVEVLKLLATDDYVASSILQVLGRTPTIRARMKKVGFFRLLPDDPRYFRQGRPTRSHEVLQKFGIEDRTGASRTAASRKATAQDRRTTSKDRRVAPELGRIVHIGHKWRGGREIRLDRAALFDRVWSEPVEKLAKTWGLSGRGLAKACHRLKIPVPPRGYWAKLQHGQRLRRPRLPVTPPGEGEEVIIHAPQ